MQFASRKGKRRTATEINLVPLIDLFLNILVFFLVTTSFASDSVFFVELPEASPSKPMGERQQIAVSVSARGDISLDRQVVTNDQLKSKLEAVPMERRGYIPVVVRADQGSLHGRVVSVIDVVRDLGFTNIGIATRNPTSE